MVIRNSSNKRRIEDAALIRGWRFLTFLSQMRRLFEGGAYSSKSGKRFGFGPEMTVGDPA